MPRAGPLARPLGSGLSLPLHVFLQGEVGDPGKKGPKGGKGEHVSTRWGWVGMHL